MRFLRRLQSGWDHLNKEGIREIEVLFPQWKKRLRTQKVLATLAGDSALELRILADGRITLYQDV